MKDALFDFLNTAEIEEFRFYNSQEQVVLCRYKNNMQVKIHVLPLGYCLNISYTVSHESEYLRFYAEQSQIRPILEKYAVFLDGENFKEAKDILRSAPSSVEVHDHFIYQSGNYNFHLGQLLLSRRDLNDFTTITVMYHQGNSINPVVPPKHSLKILAKDIHIYPILKNFVTIQEQDLSNQLENSQHFKNLLLPAVERQALKSSISEAQKRHNRTQKL